MNWLDRAIGAVAPGVGLRRARQRQMIGALARAYEGARQGRRTEGWIAAGTGANAEIAPALVRLRDRSRDLVRNNPYAGKAVQALVSNMVGTGLMPICNHCLHCLATLVNGDYIVHGIVSDYDARLHGAEEAMPKTKTPRATGYHHGNLREALIDAAVHLVEEDGPENVSVREVAKRAGVSPGAPFRHFSSKTALMTAVAEQAMSRFRLEITDAVDNVATDDPIERFAAVGVAYLRWAIRNPTHLQIISTRSLIVWDS
jgi:hypothetical protein